MRLFLYISLAGLAGLAMASPAPLKASPLAPRRLVVYTEDQFQGIPYEVEATNRCVKFNPPVYKNLHSYGVVDQVCYFMDTDKCNGKVLVTANAKGTEDWGRVDVGGIDGDAGRITSVYCGDRAFADALGTDITNAADGSAPVFRADDVAVSGVGDVRACKYNKEKESCTSVQALDSCKAFNDDFAKKIDTITQGGGSRCDYWGNKDCTRLILTSISGSNDYSPNLGPGNRDGKEISAVSCKHMGVSEMVLHGITIPNTAIKHISAPQPKRSNAQAGQVLVANQPDLGGKTQLVDTTTDDNNCAPLFNQFFWHLESLRQYQGSVCTYWQYNCGTLLENNKPLFTIDSRSGDYYASTLPDSTIGADRHKVAYIRCMNAASADAYIAQLDEDATILTAKSSSSETPSLIPRADTDINTKTYPVPLLICHDTYLHGQCFFYAGPACAENPFHGDAIESMKLVRGFRCAFYPAKDCQPTNGPPHYLTSTDGDKIINDVDWVIESMTCKPFSE